MAWSIRGVSLALGVLFLASGIAGLVSHRLDSTIWLIDVRWLPQPLGRVVGLALGISLAWAGWSGLRGAARCMGLIAGALMGILAVIDTARFYMLLAQGEIGSGFPVPASLLVSLVGVWVVLRAYLGSNSGRESDGRVRTRALVLVAAAVTIGVFPFVQMVCFGTTDYRRQADAVLVLGARAYADGSPSHALEDRMLVACELVREGRANVLILSGGPGDGAFHETDVMRRFALEHGIRDDQIVIDRDGLDTRQSVANAAMIARDRGLRGLLAVSHFYHLPRVKLESSRMSLRVATVPASQRGRVLKKLPYFMAREAVAWWWSLAKGMKA